DAFKTSAETFALATVVDRIENGAQSGAYPALGNLGTVFGPVCLNDARLGILRAQCKTLLAPELNHFGINVFGGTIDLQPAQVAVSHNLYALGLRKNLVLRAGILLGLLAARIFAERCRAFGRAIARILIGLRQIGRNAERFATDRAFVVDGFFGASQLVDGGAAGQQEGQIGRAHV